MPSLSDLGSMHISEVRVVIVEIPFSEYAGMTPDSLESLLSYNDTYRYLTELILINTEL